MCPIMKIHQDKVALITGSSRGIGKAIAIQLAGLGCSIAVNYVQNESAAKSTVETLLSMGVRAQAFQTNVGDHSKIEGLVSDVEKSLGPVDILVHNAALGAFKPVHKLRMNQYDLSFDINTKAFLILTQKVLPSMEKKKSGHIIGLSSLGSHRFIPNYGAIGPSKAALETLIRYLAVELGPKGIHVNCVSGGLVDTDALRSFPNYEEMKTEVLKRTPGGRIGQADDLANIVTFLTTPAANWIYGQTLIADGGLSLI